MLSTHPQPQNTSHHNLNLPPSKVDPMTGRGPASLHHHHGTVPHRMLIADGPETRTIMTAEKAWQDLCGKLFRIQPLTRRTLGPPNSGRGEKLLVGRLTLEWLPQPTERPSNL